MNTTSPKSRFVAITRWAAIFFLALLPLSVVAVRFSVLPVLPGLGGFAMACLGSVVVLIILIIAAMIPRSKPIRPQLLKTMLITLLPAAVAAATMGGGDNVPAIHNISTDATDPPQFVVGISQRGANSNPLIYTDEVANLQRAAYPDLTPLLSELTPEQAFVRASTLVDEMGWKTYAADENSGRIEAVDTTLWFGFKDDVVIRIRPSNQGSIVDLRSVSRVGRSDLGANAARIRNFVDQFEN
ncbi:MAG: hypothetical protein ACI9GW_000149 [Halieaceae bacterium]|jgi:uncharacterized protein (DUF1499 family)